MRIGDEMQEAINRSPSGVVQHDAILLVGRTTDYHHGYRSQLSCPLDPPDYLRTQ